MQKTAIQELNSFGQSVWLDNISRSMIKKGELKSMIALGLRGMTSNPTIFDKAVSSGTDYDREILHLHELGKSTFEIYDELTVGDVQDAADIFLSVYEETGGLDGYVSLEVNPKLAYNAKETVKEAKRLHKKVNRPNVMFKVPSTDKGFEAIEELIACGINVNITLIFSQGQYLNTASSYIKGMKRFLQDKGDAGNVRSVASVFVSRVDTLVDTFLGKLISKEKDKQQIEKLLSLKGKAASANSGLIYKKYSQIFSTKEFRQLNEGGVNLQRVLWGSTSTKNPAYSDIKYVTELIGKNTVNTMPENTFNAFLDHGTVKEALTSEAAEAENILHTLKDLGIDINAVCAQLLKDGVEAFKESFDSLLNTIEQKTRALCTK